MPNLADQIKQQNAGMIAKAEVNRGFRKLKRSAATGRKEMKWRMRRILRLFSEQHKLALQALAHGFGQCQSDDERDDWEKKIRDLKAGAKELRSLVRGD